MSGSELAQAARDVQERLGTLLDQGVKVKITLLDRRDQEIYSQTINRLNHPGDVITYKIPGGEDFTISG